MGFIYSLKIKKFLFVLSLICIFNLSFTCYKIYLFIYMLPVVCLFAMIVYLIFVCLVFHLFFNSNFYSF